MPTSQGRAGEFLPGPQSSFCIQNRDLVFNETCLAGAAETASCLFHTPLETYNKLLLTEVTRGHFYSLQFVSAYCSEGANAACYMQALQ